MGLENMKKMAEKKIFWIPTAVTMQAYARHNLDQVEAYARTLPQSPFSYFIRIPLVLAIGTLDALARGEEKLSRTAVLRLVRSEVTP